MGSVEVRFVGLHLFDNTRRDGSKCVAVINAQQNVVRWCGLRKIRLDIHYARIEVAGKIAKAEWPEAEIGGEQTFELKGKIRFSPAGTVDDRRTKLLKVNHKCPSFTVPGGFFDSLDENDKGKHALVTINAGQLTLFKRRHTESIHTCVDFGNPQSFRIEREDDQFIELDLSENATITFLNTEMTSTNNYDWLWYMNATNNQCCGAPNKNDVPDDVTVIGDIAICPITIGCSNSNWP